MELLSVYSVPIWQSEYPEFEDCRKDFLEVIKKYREENTNNIVKKSNINGHQYIDNLHHVSELRPLFEYICQMGFKSIIDLEFIECDIALTSAWLNVNFERNHMNIDHIHGDTFSGVFYLKCPKNSGKLVIPNPAINRLWNGCSLAVQKNQFTAECIKIEPIEGNIVMFPSYISHSVEPNDHDEERISISFNLIALPKGSINY